MTPSVVSHTIPVVYRNRTGIMLDSSGDMALTYFKRYRMEIDLSGSLFAPPPLAQYYTLLPWHPSLLNHHADAKYHSFCYEIDANVFPCLGNPEGCYRLMREISQRETFVPEATWLLRYLPPWRTDAEYCGTIQGILDGSAVGAVQNLGVTPSHRGQGLGTRLLYQALLGFRQIRLPRAYLEVTVQNSRALALYQRLGFRRVRTVYKAAEVSYV